MTRLFEMLWLTEHLAWLSPEKWDTLPTGEREILLAYGRIRRAQGI